MSQFSAAVMCHKANDDVIWPSERKRGLSTIPHCLEWYKLELGVRLPTPVRYLVHTTQ